MGIPPAELAGPAFALVELVHVVRISAGLEDVGGFIMPQRESLGSAFGRVIGKDIRPFLVVFVTLKLTELIDWSWWWVLSPLWGGVILTWVLVAILATVEYWIERRKAPL